MAGEGPPFLTVGTDVSAKYRGAFCEAKVKVVKKLVKCKINFKRGTSCIVSDEFIIGNLKIGAKVEAKITESSPYEDGTIMKLNDASLYTVVFDDGDEKTLRRTLLCLQGERHFHESETLDHLPLTDPENFGTPVMKDSSKMRRKRRMSNRSQKSESEEEEEEEEDSDSDSNKRHRKEEPEDAVGKIVIVEMNEKRKNSFFPALVVDPSCTKDVQTNRKDYIVARSFKDNKFYTVSRSSRKPFLSKDHTYKGDVASLKAANEKAVTFIDTGQLPPNWDMELLKKKNKSGKQVQVQSEDETSEDSSDDEYDMEKDAWLASLHKFMEERGTPINKPPVLGYRDLNLYKLYKLVQEQEGCRKVTDRQMWRHIMTKMGIPVPATQQPYNIHTSYNKYLFAFEEFNRKMGPGPRVFTRTRRRSFDRGWISPPPVISRQRSVAKQGVKDEPSDREEEEESPSKKRVTRKKGEDAGKSQEQEESKRETREAKTRSKETDKEEKDTSDRDEKRSGKKSLKDDKVKERLHKDAKDKVKDKPTKEDNVKDKVKDKSDKVKSSKEDKAKDRSKDTASKESDEKIGEKANEGKGKVKDTKGKEEKTKEEKGDRKKEEKTEEKELEAKGKEKRGKSSEREEESGSPTPQVQHITGAGYEVGEKVHVHYGRGRTEKIYEAKVVDIELKGKDHVFTVHYTGWNNRYDEAVKMSRIVGSAEKKKKKSTPKGKQPEKEKAKKDVERRDKEEQQRKEKEEADRREQEEKERRARQEQEQKEKEEAERLEKARAEKERQEKERQEKLERERKEKLERERLEKERKEKQEREKKERLEREQREKEQQERLEKERQERDRKEKQEKERKEKQEKDKREKLEREKKEKEKLEQEKQEKELADKAKEAERERKEKAGKEGKKTPTGKRGRPSLSKTSPAPQTPPRTTPSSARGKSPSPGSVFSQRSMRSDRKSLTESPFAMGLNVRSRGKRSSTGEYRRGVDDSDSDYDELDDLSESQQSTQDSEDSQQKDTSVQEPEDHDDSASTKTEDYAATLIKISEEKLNFDDDLDEGPPTLTAEVAPETVEARLQEVDSEAPKVEEEDKVSGEKEGRLKTKKESKIRLRKSIDKERDGKDSANESMKGEKVAGKDGSKGNNDLDDSKEKIDDTPVLERQIPMEAELKVKLEDLKQETKGSASDADKSTEKKKGRRKGRKSIESRKRSKAEADAAEVSEKSEASEASEPKKKQAKVDRRKSDKGGKKSKVHEAKTPADNTDSDFGTSSVDDKSIPGTSKSFMTTPPTTPESSPKMQSPAREEELQIKTEEQSSNKSDSDALIEVANLDDRETSQTRENDTPLASSAPPKKGTQSSQQASPKKRRRGLSESEPTKRRRKHSRRRQSSISERQQSAKERGNNNSSDTDESRSESRLTSSSAKRQVTLKKYAGSLPPSRVADSSGQDGAEKQRRWNFLVDLSNVKEPDERIAIIQHQLTELRSVYLQLKQEVATIDRRRKNSARRREKLLT
ncbi:AT-rich interactive domain-containing protein 4A [Strongylocentrotus purpuratus]|uniref:ARID domain-containing protein n=1 Tax=Strongylocentrotus purpuratus TaxID=7668 RepID=A0A7M7PQG3_STRPU|nr:AT-rich interactive domain-containing protein 4A [Strongylocentrotus purpuratus]